MTNATKERQLADIDVPEDLHKRITLLAAAKGISVPDLMDVVVGEYLDRPLVEFNLAPEKKVRYHSVTARRIVNNVSQIALVCRCGWVHLIPGRMKANSKRLHAILKEHIGP